MISYLIHKFILTKNNKPSNVNELLDFVQKEYVEQEISILEYRNLLRELTVRGAIKPLYEEAMNKGTEFLAL